MKDEALRKTLQFLLQSCEITRDTHFNVLKYVNGDDFLVIDEKNKKELSTHYDVIKKIYAELTDGEFLPNIFLGEEDGSETR